MAADLSYYKGHRITPRRCDGIRRTSLRGLTKGEAMKNAKIPYPDMVDEWTPEDWREFAQDVHHVLVTKKCSDVVEDCIVSMSDQEVFNLLKSAEAALLLHNNGVVVPDVLGAMLAVVRLSEEMAQRADVNGRTE